MLEGSELPGRGMRVLLVDDDDILLEVFADMLAALGADVTTATSVHEARPLLKDFRPTLVITDLYMPDESGLILRVEVREWNPSIPVVALTGSHDSEVPRDAGFAHVLQKPVMLDTMAAILNTIRQTEGLP